MTRRISLFAVAILVSVATAMPAAQSAPVQATIMSKSKILSSVQGIWAMTHANGQDMAGTGQDVLVTIKDETYVQTVNGQVVEKGTFKIDDTKKPLALDIMVVEGDEAGQKQLAIFELDPTGKIMKVAIAQPGAPVRPSAFAMAEGVETLVFAKK